MAALMAAAFQLPDFASSIRSSVMICTVFRAQRSTL
jgi:hypothetical protein